MKLHEAVERYTASRGAKELARVNTWLWVLEELSEELGERQADRITPSALSQFQAGLEWRHYYEKDLRPSRGERQSLQEALLAFFQWVAVEAAISSPDTTELPEEYPYDPSVSFTEEEVQALFDACAGLGGEYGAGRMLVSQCQAMILLLLDTGMHVSQLGWLKVGDVNLGNKEVQIKKRWASRGYTVPIGVTTSRALANYLIARGIPGSGEELFVGAGDKAITVEEVHRLFSVLGERAGVEDADPHRFRRTFAVEYLRNGGNVYALLTILGYSSRSDVLRDLEVTDARAAAEHRKASPADRLP